MMFFEPRLETVQNLYGLVDGGLCDIDFLEAPREGAIFFEDPPELLISG